MTTVGSLVDSTQARAQALTSPPTPPQAPPSPPPGLGLDTPGRPALRQSPAHRELRANLRARTSPGGRSQATGPKAADDHRARFTLQCARWSLEDAGQVLGLRPEVQSRLAGAMGVSGSLSRATPGRLAAAAEGKELLAELKHAVAQNPRISVQDRNAFVEGWITARAQGTGAHRAWTRLAATPAFWSRLDEGFRGLLASTLTQVMADRKLTRNGKPLTPQEKTAVLPAIISHHLFASASGYGRACALTDWRKAYRTATAVNQFPTQALVNRTAGHWRREYLGKLKPAAAEATHDRILQNLDHLRRHFFEPIPGSNPETTWGQVYNTTAGNDYYVSTRNFLRSADGVAACRSAYALKGAHQGADQVCGTSY